MFGLYFPYPGGGVNMPWVKGILNGRFRQVTEKHRESGPSNPAAYRSGVLACGGQRAAGVNG